MRASTVRAGTALAGRGRTGAISPRSPLALIAAGAAAVLVLWWGSTPPINGAGPALTAATLRRLVPGLHRMEVYLCGPPGMTGTAFAALTEAGVPRRRIHHESFEF